MTAVTVDRPTWDGPTGAERYLERVIAENDALRTAIAPFLAMAKACEHLPDHETIAARSVPGGNNRVVHIDVRDLRALVHAARTA